MKILSDDLINLPVYTESGKHLGKIASFEINLDTSIVEAYHVRTGLIKGLWHQHLIISPKQVVSISSEKMVVEDLATKSRIKDFKLAPAIE